MIIVKFRRLLCRIVPENDPQEDVSYKPVTLEEEYKITHKQAHCLKIGSDVKSISRASIWAPLYNSKRHDTFKVVCSQQHKPQMWFGQSKYQDTPHDEQYVSNIYFSSSFI